ncbi:MAG: hypothetical protein N3J91_16235 [Verrucomicrobiae bacterium]|nr:hypothetical protein [Verrucomicrobiae bacterium]
MTRQPLDPIPLFRPRARAAALGLCLCLIAGFPSRAADDDEWLPFAPPADPFQKSPIDLRFLNQKTAGEHGFISVKAGRFVFTQTGEPVNFWAVNGPPGNLDRAGVRQTARMLAKRGVNLVRVHGALFDKNGEPDMAKVRRAILIAEEMKAEGIYTLYSIYFPLWFRPPPDLPWLPGYDGNKHPFAALMFNPAFQEKYRRWWQALLLTPSDTTGRPLVDEPAVMGLEIQNEDSFFFWTFAANNLPDPQLRLLEKQFGDWLIQLYGSLDAAFAQWGGAREKRDAPAEGRVAFRPLWNIFNEKRPRDRDTARFLFETQRDFYRQTCQFLRKLGFKGVICASNWSTASPEVFGPLEAWSYLEGDFVDRHGYFGCNHKGPNAEWSIREGHTYSDRSALRFDPEVPGKPKEFLHPVMDIHYQNKPTMISETTFPRPNRFRTEAILYYAAYGALQGTDSLVHFALDGSQWQVKPNFWMQPWTLMSPTMMGQFPAAALIFRHALISRAPVVAHVRLNHQDLLQLKGTPLPLGAAFDELRLKDVPQGLEVKTGQRLDPLLHYVGRAEVEFSPQPFAVKLADTRGLIDRQKQTVTSATRELLLDYGRGLLLLQAPKAQGACGALRAAGPLDLPDITLASSMELGAVVAVPLDNQPLRQSRRLLLQVMSEERPTGFQFEPAGPGTNRILNLGRDPWQMRALSGELRFKRPDAARLQVTALDANGYPVAALGDARRIAFRKDTLYYYVSAPGEPAP